MYSCLTQLYFTGLCYKVGCTLQQVYTVMLLIFILLIRSCDKADLKNARAQRRTLFCIRFVCGNTKMEKSPNHKQTLGHGNR